MDQLYFNVRPKYDVDHLLPLVQMIMYLSLTSYSCLLSGCYCLRARLNWTTDFSPFSYKLLLVLRSC
ncbi:hypothetical protein PHET_07818 [Paragonimus heterotremus]|uniref:Uncharacterized protein n=1 Tax=Paragonimus heterotremus TaxID=100268 RepID=A0A8J4WGC5_9TREM|nr:hypothetical protein PHET_07818 [Paragonimus heterotremus]